MSTGTELSRLLNSARVLLIASSLSMICESWTSLIRSGVSVNSAKMLNTSSFPRLRAFSIGVSSFPGFGAVGSTLQNRYRFDNIQQDHLRMNNRSGSNNHLRSIDLLKIYKGKNLNIRRRMPSDAQNGTNFS